MPLCAARTGGEPVLTRSRCDTLRLVHRLLVSCAPQNGEADNGRVAAPDGCGFTHLLKRCENLYAVIFAGWLSAKK